MAQNWYTGPGANTGYGQNTFFNPSSNYGASQDYFNTPLGGQLREQNPNLTYAYYGNKLGIGDNQTAFSQWFYNQFPQFQHAYGQATIQNPFITIDQFMQTLPGMQQLMSQFQNLSPQARGERWGQYAPASRWISR